MPINTNELMQVLSTLADHKQMRVTVSESIKGGIIAGTCAFLGGLVLGPLGIAFGGIGGSLFASWRSNNKFKSVAEVIHNEMTPIQQARLAESCMKIVEDLKVEDAVLLLPLLLNNQAAQTAICQAIISFLQSEMRCTVID